jgi:hypothetical protein
MHFLQRIRWFYHKSDMCSIDYSKVISLSILL